MEYQVMRVSLIGYSNIIYRDFYVNKDINLDKMGIAILSSFVSNHQGYFFFMSNDEWFVPYKYKDLDDRIVKRSTKSTLNDIKLDATNSFYLIYDVDEDYQFICTLGNDVYEGEVDEGEDVEDYRIVLIKGEGQGIFEGMHKEFDEFMQTGMLPSKEPSNISFKNEYSKERYFAPLNVEFLNNLMFMDINAPSRETYDEMMDKKKLNDEELKEYIDKF